MEKRYLEPVTMEGVKVLRGSFRNFGGREAIFNDEGARNFAVALPEDIAKEMEADGWNIKWPKDKEFEEGEEDTRLPFIKVKIKYGKGRPPLVKMVTARNSNTLDEEDLDALDYANILDADIVIRPYQWGPNPRGESGISAYLQAGYFNIEENYLEEKYARIEEERHHKGE